MISSLYKHDERLWPPNAQALAGKEQLELANTLST